MKYRIKTYFIKIFNIFKQLNQSSNIRRIMDSDKKPTPSVSKSITKTSKSSQDSSVSSEKSRTKETKDFGKPTKVVKSQSKEIKHETLTAQPPQHLLANIQKLHDKTKRVKAKLILHQKPKVMMVAPSGNSAAGRKPKNTNQQPSLTATTSGWVNSELSEEAILKEIQRLQELMEKVRLQKASSTEVEDKEQNTRNLSQSDADAKVESNDKADADESSSKTKTKKRRRRDSKRTKKKHSSESQLQELYESHINRIVYKDTTEKNPDSDGLRFKFGDNLEEFATKCVEADLGRIVEAEIRINAKNNHQAFLTLKDGPDAMIRSIATRRYAVDGDIVRAFVRNPSDESKNVSICMDDSNVTLEDPDAAIDDPDATLENPDVAIDDSNANLEDPDITIDDPEDTVVKDVNILKLSEGTGMACNDRAFVIRVVQESGNREFVGSIAFKNPSKHDDGEYFKFKPRDTKAPIMCIPVESCEKLLKEHESDDILGFLFVARILKTEENGRCLGELVAPVGKVGHLEAEIKAILMQNHLNDVQPFEKRFDDAWVGPIKIQVSDLESREDLRDDCIFTIDPLTARDLDDAVSCKTLEDGRYEIGVHISDVTHFLQEASELDEIVKLRATSIYLVNEVIHMLPQALCMKCSLLPNEDKFAFSVFWIMDKDANVISTRFKRSIIRSCTQLAYEHAQKIIDNPDEVFTDEDFPTICNGFSAADIVERVKILNSLAEIMRSKRFANGSLSIDKPQFFFHFDPKTGEPTDYEIASRLTANFLIEEFMLLANQSVAQFIYKSFPDISFLRNHLPPKQSAIKNLKTKLNAVGIELDMSTSKTIYEGLKKICGTSSSPEVVSVALNYLLTKPMMRAKYFCSENVEMESDLSHYALAIPIYTHFTSPIRRYPDILVHRLLSASLKYTEAPKRTPEELHQLAKVCNDQKLNAKNAGEDCSNLFFKRYVKEKKSVKMSAVVVDIFRHSVEVVVLETGHLIMVPFKLQKVVVDVSKVPTSVRISEKNSEKPPIELKMFSSVDIKLMIWENRLTGFFVSPDPQQRKKNDLASSGSKLEKPEVAPSPGTSHLTATQKRKSRRARKHGRKSTKSVSEE